MWLLKGVLLLAGLFWVFWGTVAAMETDRPTQWAGWTLVLGGAAMAFASLVLIGK